MPNDAEDNAGVVAIPPLIYLAGLAVGLVFDFLFPLPLIADTTQYAVGGALIIVSFLPMPLVMRRFRKAGTSFDTREPVSVIVSDGPYKYSRNPAYAAMTLLNVGIAVAVDGIWLLAALIVVLVVMHYGVITREEAYLERKFGDEYLSYKAKVRRWI